jgi:DNA-binding MarR family transcriptional regulator
MILFYIVTTVKGRGERQRWTPDLAVLAARLASSTQQELFDELHERGHRDVGLRHGPVIAFLDSDGVRATDLARLSGLHKQVIGRLVDELEELDIVARTPDPADRRAKLVVPTRKGIALVLDADEIVAGIESRHAQAVGRKTYAAFRDAMRDVVQNSRPIRPIG